MRGRRTCARTWRRTCTLRSLLRLPSRACVPSFFGACVARGLLLPVGRRCAPPRWRASGSLGGRRACVASTMPSSTQ
eukprot:13114431-Alexandrium_andersonii.AAC.1